MINIKMKRIASCKPYSFLIMPYVNSTNFLLVALISLRMLSLRRIDKETETLTAAPCLAGSGTIFCRVIRTDPTKIGFCFAYFYFFPEKLSDKVFEKRLF